MKRAEENLILGIGIGYFLCHMMKAQQNQPAPTAPTSSLPPIVRSVPSRKMPLPSGNAMARIGRRPWPMQNPLMYMAY